MRYDQECFKFAPAIPPSNKFEGLLAGYFMKITIDLKGANDLKNLSFDQAHNTYIELRKQRKAAIDEARQRAFEVLKDKFVCLYCIADDRKFPWFGD